MTPRVALIGAGGLGGPLAYALAAAGVHLTICDDDVVELSNLQRQVQFGTRDIGRPKVVALADELHRRGHARASLRPLRMRFSAATAAEILDKADVVVDGSDDFATKFEVNDRALALGMPYVISAALQYTGQVFAYGLPVAQATAPVAIDAGDAVGCYRCLFEVPPADADSEGQSCAQAGVFGATVAVIGGLAAHAALSLAFGRPLFGGARAGGLWVIDDVRRMDRGSWARAIPFQPRRDCPACAGLATRAAATA